MSRSTNLAVFTTCIALMSVCFLLAPDFFETGGLLHHALIHIGTVIGAVGAITAARHILND